MFAVICLFENQTLSRFFQSTGGQGLAWCLVSSSDTKAPRNHPRNREGAILALRRPRVTGNSKIEWDVCI